MACKGEPRLRDPNRLRRTVILWPTSFITVTTLRKVFHPKSFSSPHDRHNYDGSAYSEHDQHARLSRAHLSQPAADTRLSLARVSLWHHRPQRWQVHPQTCFDRCEHQQSLAWRRRPQRRQALGAAGRKGGRHTPNRASTEPASTESRFNRVSSTEARVNRVSLPIVTKSDNLQPLKTS